ncbi:hypothetical protein, partial [Burkholderia multivorans]|uniref:hypothetical protein n=1 Tax=Burkholderia multivorans TaxID=87883 RepID=UPI0011B93729
HVQDEHGLRPLDSAARRRLIEQANAYNEDGFRVLVLHVRRYREHFVDRALADQQMGAVRVGDDDRQPAAH